VSYGVAWDRNAEQFVLGLADPSFASAILDGADRLAAAPTRLSRPDGVPHYGTEQRYVFHVAGRQVTLFFRYSQDEQWLHITDVSVLPPP
jgi:hypothetical protein